MRAGIALHLEWLNQEIERLPQTIRAHIDRDPSLRDVQRLLDSIFGL